MANSSPPAPAGAVIGLDIGGTDIKSALMDSQAQLLLTGRRPTPVASGVPAVVTALVEEIQRLQAAATVEVRAVGLIFPGTMDVQAGIAKYSANIGWRDLAIVAEVGARVGLPVGIDHDMRAGGRAEARFGAARGVADAVFVGIGTGISAAVISGGAMLTGAAGMAGEIGHLPVVADGEPCACGQRGCAETYASAAALPRRYRAAGGSAEVSTAREVLARAAAGEAPAVAVFADAVTALARMLVSCTVLLDPALIVLGGGLAQAGDALFTPVAAALAESLTWRPAPPLAPAQLGADTGRIGAGLVAWQTVADGQAASV